ncbi:MAG: sigma-70 family RNA polymerase sigma factor [Actinomycetota bacterium]|nr:sigma-70 family RNA polymerase sigma factor [Actinomycetota bacterium]
MESNPEKFLKSLVAKAKEGNRAAYGKIFRFCYADIYDYILRRVGNRADAEDLTMRVFEMGLEAMPTYEERGHSVRAWLYRIAHNAVVDYFRLSKKDIDIESLPPIVDEAKDIEAKLLYREDLAELYEEVRGMSTAQAEVLVLRFIEDLSVAETAEVLGKKEATVRALQFKAIKNLREKIEKKSEEDEE